MSAGPAALPPAGARLGRRVTNVALALVVAVAVGLRAWRVGHGLPDFLEEALPFRLAIGMWGWETGRVDWNPHQFHYPSLATYLQLLLQQAGSMLGRLTRGDAGRDDYLLAYLTDPTPMVIAGRLLQVAFDAAAVLGAARLAERLRPGAGVLAAVLAAFSPTLIRTSHAIYTDTISGALAVWSLERMLAWRERGGTRRLVAAAALAGLATGAKYPAAILLAPLAWVAWDREGAGGARSWLRGAAVALAAFAVTTPFAFLDAASFARDVGFERLHAETGHFGSFARTGLAYHLGNLATNVGWPGLVALAVSLGWTAAVPRRRAAAATLWIALLLFGLPIALARIAAERYLVPVLPIAAVLFAEAALALIRRARPVRHPGIEAIVMAALLAAPMWAGTEAARAEEDRTRIEARRWCEAHLGRDQVMVQEGYGVELPTPVQRIDVVSSRVYARASEAARRRYDALRLHRVVDLPLLVSGRCSTRVRPAHGPPVELDIFPNAVDFNRVFYDPRLFEAADLVLTSSAVRGRFEADTGRYAVERALYRRLDRAAAIAAAFRPRRPDEGPAITIYRIGPAARAALDSAAALEPLWWAAPIPDGYRRAATALLEPRPSGDSARVTALLDPRGRPSPWVMSLAAVHETYVHPFAREMAIELIGAGRPGAARPFAASNAEMAPGDEETCLLLATCDERLGDWAAARATVERGLATYPDSAPPPSLLLEHAETLANTGEPAAARAALERVIAGADRGSPLERAAREKLAALEARPRPSR
ncbi:MAG TPA: glycosyltransferase family 39 protein [Candidatus Eisenbacteria bacterium]